MERWRTSASVSSAVVSGAPVSSTPVSSAPASNVTESRTGRSAKLAWLMPLLGLALLFCLPPKSHAQDGPRPATGGNGKQRTAVFAGGCFWCIEKDFEKAPGVIDVVSGYTGGTTKNPTYKTYTGGRHREAVMVTYDPTKVTFAGLVEFLIKHIDPVDKRGSFIDRGVQYSPAIYFEDEQEKEAAERVIKAINAMKVYRAPISMAIVPRSEFFPAEEYHQDFHVKNEAKYNLYRTQCGRDRFVKSIWGDRANELTLPGAYPEGVQPATSPKK